MDLNHTEDCNNNSLELGLYLHIPFCAKKCDYCDFLSSPASQDTIHRYFQSMLTEIEQYKGITEGYTVPTIFIGGGTPSVVPEGYIERIFNSVRKTFSIEENLIEATIEINPGTVTKEKLQTYRRIGINRLSFGLQSANNEELSLLGRIHTYEQFVENYHLARELGFRNINIDLMSALPGQTLQAWENTLEKIIGLNPEHISAYSLIIEEGTKFYERYHSDRNMELPDEDTDRLIYHRTKEILKKNGYHRYEVSNYAKPGYESRHNSSYWTGKDYLGIGLGAASLWKGTRFSNLRELETYITKCEAFCNAMDDPAIIPGNDLMKNPTENVSKGLGDAIGLRTDYEKLTRQQRMEEFMFLGLRLCEGISKNTFRQRFHTKLDSVYGEEIRKLEKEKLLQLQGDRILLTDFGIDISNYVLSAFLKED